MKEKNHKEPTSFFRMENIMHLWSHFASQGENVVTINAHIKIGSSLYNMLFEFG